MLARLRLHLGPKFLSWQLEPSVDPLFWVGDGDRFWSWQLEPEKIIIENVGIKGRRDYETCCRNNETCCQDNET